LEEEGSIVVERLCGKLFLVCDRDEAKGKKQLRHDKLKEKLGNRYYRLESREVENLLSPPVISAVVQDYEGNSPTLQPFTQEDYKQASLGTFIETKILTHPKRKYASESGTIDDKPKFCQRAIAHIKSFTELSPEAQELTKTLYRFILSQNSPTER
jgi:hypothetical protein